MAAKKGLGKGLDSLITDKVSKPVKPKSNHAADAVMIDINKVEPNREQPRKKFDEDALIELSESIKQFGILQPLLCQERDDYYEIVAGERRWRAAKLAGLKEVPVIIKKLTNQQIMEISLIENIQREDLNPIEEALAYKRLLEEFKLKQDDVAEVNDPDGWTFVYEEAGKDSEFLENYPQLNNGNLVEVLGTQKGSDGAVWNLISIAGAYAGYVRADLLKRK